MSDAATKTGEMFRKERDMGDMRDKIETIAGFSGKGAVSEAAMKLGVTTRTLHRAIANGPSERLAAAIERAVKNETFGRMTPDQRSAEIREEEECGRLVIEMNGCIKHMLECTANLPAEKDMQVGIVYGQMIALRDALKSGEPGAWVIKIASGIVETSRERNV